MPRLLAATDKFKGTASAAAIAGGVCAGAERSGWECEALELSDGGEGLLDVFGGPNKETAVPGPLGAEVLACWRLDAAGGDGSRGWHAAAGGAVTAVVEMAEAAGLTLAGGPGQNDAVAATTAGVGDLVLAALDAGAGRIVVGCGGSATTDGGLGAVLAIGNGSLAAARRRLAGVELVVACDVRTPFAEAARAFAGQKGAGAAEVELLSARLGSLAELYEAELGYRVNDAEGSGAAGGLAGGLGALGGRLVAGFDLVAEALGLAGRMEGCNAVVTGEGRLDAGSFEGKVVGGVAGLAADAGIPALCVAASATTDGLTRASDAGLAVIDLSGHLGLTGMIEDPAGHVGEVVAAWLGALGGGEGHA